VALAPLGLALGGAGCVALVLLPARGRTAALETRRAALEGQVLQVRTAVAGLTRDHHANAELERRLELIARRLPAEREIPAVYRALHDAARETGLAVSLFQPRDARVHTDYVEIPIGVSAEGTYHQLGAFLARVAALGRVVTVSGLKLTGIERPGASLRAELALATYASRPAGERAVPSGPSAGGPSAVDSTATPPYSARGRRDPFESVALAGAVPATRRRAALASATVTGIVRGPDGPLALVEMADGVGHIVRAGDGIEGARVIRIGPDSVTLDVLPGPGLAGERIVLSLGRAK
jgi:type IV pilus assembly protein PilO